MKNPLQEVLERAGLQFHVPEQRDYAAIAGKRAFSHLIRNPTFTNLGEMHDAVTQIPEAVKVPMTYTHQGVTHTSARDKAVVNAQTGEHYGTVSPGYQMVQNRDIWMEAFEAVRDLGLTPIGSIRQEGGRFLGMVMLADPAYRIPLLTAHDRFIMTGFSLFNSYRGDAKVRAQGSGIDAVCTNYNLWGREIALFEATHVKQGDVNAGVRHVLEEVLRNAPRAEALFQAAHEIVIQPDEVREVLAGSGFSVPQADAIAKDRATLEPETRVKLTALTLNLAATGYATHVANTNPASLRELALAANQLLTTPVAKLRERGQERIQAHEEAQARREAREKRKAPQGIAPARQEAPA